MHLLELNLGFEQHTTLNPLLWRNDSLIPEVKSALLNITQDFVEYVDVPFTIKDIIILLND